MPLLDIRHLQTASGPKGACKLDRKGRMILRDPKTIDTLVAHQTACTFGVSAQQIKAAGGDPALAQFMRAKNVHAHVTAFDEGTFVFAYPFRAYVQHGNGSNPYSIGKEDEGYFKGWLGDKVPGRGEPTDLLIETSRAACLAIMEESSKEGINLRYYEAHRQHSKDRRADPGHRLWKAVYVEYAEPVLGLKPRPTRTTRSGLVIPREWDDRQTGAY